MSNEKEYLSKEKFKELEEELAYLKSTRRKEIAENLQYAKSLGDLAENAEYHEARSEQAKVEERISQLETVLSNAAIISTKKQDVVGVGSVVIVKKDGDSGKKEYKIVGSEEASTAEGKISYKSPIGEALIGKSKGDVAVSETPGGKIKYTIVDIKCVSCPATNESYLRKLLFVSLFRLIFSGIFRISFWVSSFKK